MSVTYGTQMSTLLARDVSADEEVKPGATYSANYAITGLRRELGLGWEDEAIYSIRNGMESQGFEIVYIGVDPDKDGIDVQWRMPYTADAQAKPAFLLPLAYIVASVVIVAIVAYLLIITIVGAVKEISTVMTDNPAMIPVVYGAIAIGGLIAIAYLYKQIKGE